PRAVAGGPERCVSHLAGNWSVDRERSRGTRSIIGGAFSQRQRARSCVCYSLQNLGSTPEDAAHPVRVAVVDGSQHGDTLMLTGVYYFPTDYGIDIQELARALEDRGYDALFVCEHTHIPASRRTPFPGGGELPMKYKHTHDPFVALSFAAAATRRLKLGTGICLVPQRDPIVTAKSVASLDQMSHGRFIFAIGGGWNVDEMENHGARYETRFRLLRERVLAMKALWTQDTAQFHGNYVNFDPAWMY